MRMIMVLLHLLYDETVVKTSNSAKFSNCVTDLCYI